MLLDRYRAQWPRIGAILAMLVGGATAVAGKRLTRPQILSAANLMALMAHQYEEYVDPGFTALLLHLPIGIGYLTAVGQEGPIGRKDWVKGLIGALGSAVFGVAVPNMVMRDRNSPYAFTAKQMGPYDVQAGSAAESVEV